MGKTRGQNLQFEILFEEVEKDPSLNANADENNPSQEWKDLKLLLDDIGNGKSKKTPKQWITVTQMIIIKLIFLFYICVLPYLYIFFLLISRLGIIIKKDALMARRNEKLGIPITNANYKRVIEVLGALGVLPQETSTKNIKELIEKNKLKRQAEASMDSGLGETSLGKRSRNETVFNETMGSSKTSTQIIIR